MIDVQPRTVVERKVVRDLPGILTIETNRVRRRVVVAVSAPLKQYQRQAGNIKLRAGQVGRGRSGRRIAVGKVKADERGLRGGCLESDERHSPVQILILAPEQERLKNVVLHRPVRNAELEIETALGNGEIVVELILVLTLVVGKVKGRSYDAEATEVELS